MAENGTRPPAHRDELQVCYSPSGISHAREQLTERLCRGAGRLLTSPLPAAACAKRFTARPGGWGVGFSFEAFAQEVKKGQE